MCSVRYRYISVRYISTYTERNLVPHSEAHLHNTVPLLLVTGTKQTESRNTVPPLLVTGPKQAAFRHTVAPTLATGGRKTEFRTNLQVATVGLRIYSKSDCRGENTPDKQNTCL